MEQARNYVCKECSTPVPSGHKFCGRCGAGVPQEIVDLQVKFFGAMQAPGKARLILIRGDQGVEGPAGLESQCEGVGGQAYQGEIAQQEDGGLGTRAERDGHDAVGAPRVGHLRQDRHDDQRN